MTRDKAIRLVEYLTRLASLRTKLIRDISEYGERVLWINDIPKQKACFTQAWGRDEEYDTDIWIEVQNRREPELPGFPENCRDWVDRTALRSKDEIPELLEEITRQIRNPAWGEGSDQPEFIQRTERLDDRPELQRAWDRYIEEHWLPWTEQHNIWESIHRAYSRLFAIHQEQLRLGEEYELVLGLGLLTWQTPSGHRVRRHLIVANAFLEFESRLGKFTVRASIDGANVRPELDMLDIEDQPVRAEEAAKSSLADADDPWEKDCIEGVLKALVHSINAQGEYDETLAAANSQGTPKPIVEYAPALILRKRSARGLTETLKRIRQRIEEREDIPTEFADLAEIEPRNDADSVTGREEIHCVPDSEVFFPKPSNQEQRQIVDKLRSASGVLVQGPPGTGKSHTIANLICHLLATGQRILVTAKTPRALQVLEGLLPSELRPLCINLLGSGLEEKHSLESSVGGILRKNEEWSELWAPKERENLERKLRELREEKARLARRLRDIRESETHSQSIAEGTYRGTAAQIAQAVSRNRNTYGWFTDAAPLDKTCPVSEDDLRSILMGLRRFTPERRRETSLAWPDALPSPEQFAGLVEREKQACEQEDSLAQGADNQIADRLTQSNIDSIQANIDSFCGFNNEHLRLLSSPHAWVRDALHQVMAGNSRLWEERCRATRERIAYVETLVPVADATDVNLPDGANIKAVLEDACTLKEHLQKAGKLGRWWFRPKLVKERMYILKTVRVNGRPCNRLELLSVLVDTLRVRIEFDKIWGFWADCHEKIEGPCALQLQAVKSLCDALDDVLSLESHIDECRKGLRKCSALTEPIWADGSQVEKLIASCRLAVARINKRHATEQICDIEIHVATVRAKADAHTIVAELLDAIRKRDTDEFARVTAQFDRLGKEREDLQRTDKSLQNLRSLLPEFTGELERTPNDSCWDNRVESVRAAWHWAQARFWLEEYTRKEDAPSLARRAAQVEEEINSTIARLASLQAWSFCFSRLTENHRRHMEAWCKYFKAITKTGRGKRDFRNRQAAQRSLNECRDAVPAWVMPLHRVWDTIDPSPEMFDIIIVDEASQCDFESLPLFFIGKKILIVGDDKQISPGGEFQDTAPINRLLSEYLYDFHFKEYFDVNVSLFDHGKLRYGTRKIALREHFRCMPEIIRFSNDLCYSDTPLIPLRQYGPERLAPLERVFVIGGYREGAGNHVVNRPEAEAVVAKIVELCRDPRYAGKSMGVVVLQGEAQAGLIEAQLLERLGAEEMERRRLICGNPYSFQGDERDIIFLSMVAAPNETIGPFTKPADERRFNVAASRARDQMWLFHSATSSDLSDSCFRRKLLEFFENPYSPRIGSIDLEELERKADYENRSEVKPPAPFHQPGVVEGSWFEVDVALVLLRRGYRVIPQFHIAGKFIDLVIEGGQARLAVECDGDESHGLDHYEADMERQRMLERCGWQFFRVRAAAFYGNKEEALRDLWRLLDERGIRPFVRTEPAESQTTGPSDRAPAGHERDSSMGSEETAWTKDGTEQVVTVRLGSTVCYVREDDGIECQALITSDESNPEWGTVNANTPIAKALIGGKIDQVVIAYLPAGPARLRIVDIR